MTISYQFPKKYLYEPNASLLKAGAFKSITEEFPVYKLGANTHLYTSDILVKNFQGRCFEIKELLSFDKKKIIAYLPDKKANISVRNFPWTVAEIRKKIGIKEGGEQYIFATTDKNNQKIVLLCCKI